MSTLFDRLNREQRRAVETTRGPLLVLAGAGTGKTSVITARIARLLSRRVAARSILALTFTNKAAAEMRERIAAVVGARKARELTIGTFHSFCARTLRAHAAKLGMPAGFSIHDEADQLTSVKGALRELRIPEATIHPRVLRSRISLLKNRLITAERFLEQAAGDQDELVGRAYRAYEQQLRRSRSMDFDDLLLYMVRLLTEDDEVRAALQQRYRFVMVDEYQDTNAPQYEIVRLLAEHHRNLCVVGDDDQSIYGWRGADLSKILGFERDFTGAAVVRLQVNYRSTEQILAAANRVIRHNRNRHEKHLESAAGRGEDVVILGFDDELSEARYVVRDVREQIEKQFVKSGAIAILVRAQVQTRLFEVELRAHSIPYHLVGGQSFFDRKEVKDLLAFLRLVTNPEDESALLRIINCPPRGVGKATVERALAFATEQGIPIGKAFDRAAEIPGISAGAVAAVQTLRTTLARIGSREPGRRLVDSVRAVLEATRYRREVERCYPDPSTREDRWLSVTEVLNFAENHVKGHSQPTLHGFLDELTLSVNDDRSDDQERRREGVTIMTLHAAKGLEFPRVYLVGLEEGILPHIRAVEAGTVEEERRLAYVGITRAQRVLKLSYARSRARQGRRLTSMRSRFLYELEDREPPDDWRPAGAPAPRPVPTRRRGSRPRGRRRPQRGARAHGAR